MRVIRLDSAITETFMIGKKTFRFIRMDDSTGYTVISADEWTGWQWKRRHMWTGDSRPMGAVGRFSRGAKAGRSRASQ